MHEESDAVEDALEAEVKFRFDAGLVIKGSGGSDGRDLGEALGVDELAEHFAIGTAVFRGAGLVGRREVEGQAGFASDEDAE